METADLGGIRSGSIGYVTYSDVIMSNGGQIAEVKSFSMDTHVMTAGLFNIETAKVLTYPSQNGSHLMGEESYALDVAGNWSETGPIDLMTLFVSLHGCQRMQFWHSVTKLLHHPS